MLAMASRPDTPVMDDRYLGGYDREMIRMSGYMNPAFSLAPPRCDIKQNVKPDR